MIKYDFSTKIQCTKYTSETFLFVFYKAKEPETISQANTFATRVRLDTSQINV